MDLSPADLLARLVAFPSVCRRPNGEIVAFAKDRLEALGAAVTVLPGPEGDRANLFASFGPRDRPGYVLSGHLDVVPADQDGWTGDPFTLRRRDGRLIGRGACDMKGFVATVLSALAALPADLERPLHVALSYDEEIGCVGVRHLLARLPDLCAPPLGAIIGEPSELRPVLRHKGKVAGKITLRGRAGHSSRPDLAENAIHLAAEAVLAIRDLHARFAADGPFHHDFAPPVSTLQVGIIAGGSGVNIVPDACRLDWEARAVPGVDPAAIEAQVEAAVAGIVAGRDLASAECETLAAYPALDLPGGSDLARLVADLAGHAPEGAVSYGTEAGLFQAAGIPAIICGPGSIAEAHRPDESIAEAELAECRALLLRLFDRLT
ncbi:acetylornithine deacetylase [Aureimonas endophytica]|uniref:Acetylornithine deacetylase n=1 Tax=Aureimonas endophytica TaxID=2027858 RepID=A0A916ZRC2_9HYPH|nr:acetylornithine deacetylase [Aureimonas endophytica]GGE10405.1 acetylornithine deacetylase [Aureimonas endophytica]